MIGDLIGEWIKGILIDGIMGNLSGLFNTVNTKVGEIASDVGSTPQDWNGGIFSMLQNLSETVIVPIAAAILALVMCYELIDMIVEKNNIYHSLYDSHSAFKQHAHSRKNYHLYRDLFYQCNCPAGDLSKRLLFVLCKRRGNVRGNAA